MIFSNLAGTTNNQFKVNGDGTGQILSNNAYDLFWGAHNTKTNIQNPNIRYINNGTDMNDLLHYGQYSCYVSSIATTLVNRPTDYAFVMEVYPSVGVGTSYITQKVTDLLCNVYLRKYDGVWTAWKQVAYTSDLHAVATSGDYNALINKPNVSAGPTVETGTFALKSTNGTVSGFPSNKYIKYGNVVMVDMSCKISPEVLDGSPIYLSGLPFLPEISKKGVYLSSATNLKNNTRLIFVAVSVLNSGTITVALNTTNLVYTLAGNLIYGTLEMFGNIVYITK